MCVLLLCTENFKTSRLVLQAWLQSAPELVVIGLILYRNISTGPAVVVPAPLLLQVRCHRERWFLLQPLILFYVFELIEPGALASSVCRPSCAGACMHAIQLLVSQECCKHCFLAAGLVTTRDCLLHAIML